MDLTQIFTTVISFVGTLAGSLTGIIVSNKLTNYRIEQLEKRVEMLAKIDSRVCTLEAQMQFVKEREAEN